MKSCMVGGLQVVVLSFEFHESRLSGFGAVGGRNLPIPIDLAIGSAKHLTMFTGVFTLSVNEPEVLLPGLFRLPKT